MITIEIDGSFFPVARALSENRAIVQYFGLYVLVDKVDGTWNLSGEPARPGVEQAAMKELTAPMEGKTVTTATIPDLPEDGTPPDFIKD